MTTSILALVSLVLAGAALAIALLTVALILVRKKETAALAWLASSLGVLGLAAAVPGGSTGLDLATVAGVVLLGGVAGAGWAPRGRRVFLLLGLLCLAVGLLARLSVASDLLLAAVPDALSWGMARSSGFVAFLAATGAVILGTRRPSRLPIGGLPVRIYALHRALGIVAILAMVVHLVALWADDFVDFSPSQLLLLPWTSEYEPFAVTLGWLAMIALALTAASGGLRRLLPGGAWRIVHTLAYLTFALGLLHGLLAGSDAGSPFALAFYLAALLAVGWAAYRRLFSPSPPPSRGPRKAPTEVLVGSLQGLPDTSKRPAKP